jgi:tetraacyldisaccharide 4'-kinase
VNVPDPEDVWYSKSTAAALARVMLAPAGWMYCAASSLRNRLYDAGLLQSVEPVLPTLSIGNLTVGGTGKTPIAAWAARQLLERGEHPAIVLRGYGADEPLVHRQLNPDAVVIADADRVRAVEQAKSLGADCVILDDAYQHRRIRRRENWLLVAAERWGRAQRCLPAGPLREPLSAVDRATVIIVTRKSASPPAAREVANRLAARAGDIPLAMVHLAPATLVNVLDRTSRAIETLSGRKVLAVAAVGDPRAFFAQLRATGANVDEAAYRDHHAFHASDVAEIVRRGTPRDLVLCTLKDAVKLAPLWPHTGPALWYVSQGAEVEHGEAALDTSLTTLLAARASAPPTAGTAGPDSTAHGHRSSTADQ